MYFKNIICTEQFSERHDSYFLSKMLLNKLINTKQDKYSYIIKYYLFNKFNKVMRLLLTSMLKNYISIYNMEELCFLMLLVYKHI